MFKKIHERINSTNESLGILKDHLWSDIQRNRYNTLMGERQRSPIGFHYEPDGPPVKEAVQLILDHLGLEIERIPETDTHYKLVEKETE